MATNSVSPDDVATSSLTGTHQAGEVEPMPARAPRPRTFRVGILISLLCLAALIVFSLLHVGEARRFVRLAERAEPAWLLLGLALQILTYFCAGAIWGRVAALAGHRLSATYLARMSLGKLSVDQFVPPGGVSGMVVVISAMRRMGVPAFVATEALLVEVLSQYAAYAGAAAITLALLWSHDHVLALLLGLLGTFAVLAAAVPLVVAWLLRHRSYRPGPRLARVRILSDVLEALRQVSVQRIWNPRVLLVATALQLGILLLDAATLWTALKALGTPVPPLTTFVALVLATIAATVTFLPAGVGSFEAASTATLAMLGVPVEAALTGTLLLRGLTLWLPFVPGIILARGDLAGRARV